MEKEIVRAANRYKKDTNFGAYLDNAIAQLTEMRDDAASSKNEAKLRRRRLATVIDEIETQAIYANVKETKLTPEETEAFKSFFAELEKVTIKFDTYDIQWSNGHDDATTDEVDVYEIRYEILGVEIVFDIEIHAECKHVVGASVLIDDFVEYEFTTHGDELGYYSDNMNPLGLIKCTEDVEDIWKVGARFPTMSRGRFYAFLLFILMTELVGESNLNADCEELELYTLLKDFADV